MTNKNELFDEIKEHILKSSDGDKIETESQLAKRFGISRYRIRKVLETLVQMGMLERSPRKGTTIKQPDQSDMNDQLMLQFDAFGFDAAEFIEARILIECSILPLAVRRITPSMVSKLEYNLKKIEENASDPHEADKYDKEFHLLLLQASGNRVLQTFSDVLVTWFDKTTDMLSTFSPDFFVNVAEKQREILTYIKKGDTDKAAELMRAHLLETLEML